MPVHIITEMLNGAVSAFFLSSASICVHRLTVSLGLGLTCEVLWAGSGTKDGNQTAFGGEG